MSMCLSNESFLAVEYVSQYLHLKIRPKWILSLWNFKPSLLVKVILHSSHMKSECSCNSAHFFCSKIFTPLPSTISTQFWPFHSLVNLLVMLPNSVWVNIRVFTICALLLKHSMLLSLVSLHGQIFWRFETALVAFLQNRTLQQEFLLFLVILFHSDCSRWRRHLEIILNFRKRLVNGSLL